MRRNCAASNAKSGALLLSSALLVVAGTHGSATAQAPTPPPDPVERASWQGEVVAASQLEVTNPFGDLRLRFGGPGRTLEVQALIQQLDPAGSRLELAVDAAADPAVVRVARSTAQGQAQANRGGDRSRADLVVLVPAGLAVRARTEHGLLESRGLESDIELETVRGEIRVRSTRGRVTTHNDRGATAVVLLPGATKEPQSLSSTTGPIEVSLSDDHALDVTLATSGRLISDFSMVVEHHNREEPDKVATARIGAGGAALELRSRRGDLSLRRLLRPEDLAVTAGDERPSP